MNRFAILTAPHWTAGVSLAIAGVLLARLGVPALPAEWRTLGKAAGELLAFGGIGVIAWGVSRRVRAAPPG
jgi:hypothetical protein